MQKKYCPACGQPFLPFPQVPSQLYCSAKKCQRDRKRQWQRERLRLDPDYQDNQSNAQKAWSLRHPEYWREYRKSHPKYAERNRSLQHERNTKKITSEIAKMDASSQKISLSSGTYRLTLVANGAVAKMDVWTVQITVLDWCQGPESKIAKRGRIQ